MRALLMDSVELQRTHYAVQEDAVAKHLALQQKHLDAADLYNQTIDKRLGESNSLFAQMLTKL